MTLRGLRLIDTKRIYAVCIFHSPFYEKPVNIAYCVEKSIEVMDIPEKS